MEAHYVEAGSMSIFWTQNRALKTTSLARVLIRTWWDPVGPSSLYGGTQIGLGGTRWGPALLYVGPKSGSWDAVGPGGSQPFSTWDPAPRLGFTMLIRVRGVPFSLPFSVVVQVCVQPVCSIIWWELGTSNVDR